MNASLAWLSALAALAALAGIKVRPPYLKVGAAFACLIGCGYLTATLLHQDVAYLRQIAAGLIVGTVAGIATAMLVGFLQRRPSAEVSSGLTSVYAKLSEMAGGERGLDAVDDVQEFVLSAEAVAVTAFAIDAHLGLFSQGPTSSAWMTLRRYEHQLMKRGLAILSEVELRAGAAESPEARGMFMAQAEQLQRGIGLVRAATDAVGGRIAHYQGVTALLVATVALAVSMVSLALQASLQR